MRSIDYVLDKTTLGYSRIGYQVRRRSWPADPPRSALVGKRVLVTGGGGGLGLSTAHGLAALGADLHLVGRGVGRLDAAAAELHTAHPGVDIAVAVCDVSDVESVRELAGDLERSGPLHALIHNAGVMPPSRSTSTQGNEATLATHVLGPFLMTELLRPALATDGDARVVWVSSGGMYSQPFTQSMADDLEFERTTYDGVSAYARTKRMQVIVSGMFADVMRREGTVVHSMHPGWASTPGLTESLPRFARVIAPLLRSPAQGSDTAVWLASSPDAARTTGAFWHDRRPRPETYLRSQRESPALRQRLWDYCIEATGVHPA